MKKKVLFAAGAMIIAAVLSVAVCHDTRDSFFEANVEALASTENFQTEYVREEGTCKMQVSGSVKLKLKQAGFVVSGDGTITLEGKVICHSGGNSSCTPIECKDLLETILSNL